MSKLYSTIKAISVALSNLIEITDISKTFKATVCLVIKRKLSKMLKPKLKLFFI